MLLGLLAILQAQDIARAIDQQSRYLAGIEAPAVWARMLCRKREAGFTG
jgi:hypothetical protein